MHGRAIPAFVYLHRPGVTAADYRFCGAGEGKERTREDPRICTFNPCSAL